MGIIARCVVLALGLGWATVSTAAVAGETLVFKSRNNNYTGGRDTALNKLQPDKVQNGKAVMSVTMHETANPRCDRTLVRFDDLKLPPKAEIVRARLRVYAFELKPSGDQPETPVVKIAALLRNWNDQTATWKLADADQPWGEAGAGKEAPAGADKFDGGFDRGPSFQEVTLSFAGFKAGYVEFDVTESLKRGLAEGKNYGWILHGEAAKGSNAGTVMFRDQEFKREFAPELAIDWDVRLPE